MARIGPQGCIGYFGWFSCRAPSCPYNTTGVKVSNWWLFLCLCYCSCFLVGIAFAVAGFASMGVEMAAVGVVLVIVGACLAFLCDLLRRCGCGWTKIVPETVYPRQIVQETAEVVLPIPFLPGYPGFSTSGEATPPDNPPPYTTSQGSENLNTTLWCSCGASVNLTESVRVTENPCSRHVISTEVSNTAQIPSRPETSSEVGIELITPAVTAQEQRTVNPPPPPYDFESLAGSEDRISWLYDIPPPYGDLV